MARIDGVATSQAGPIVKLVYRFMRRGMKPTDACLETLKRVVQLTEPRLLGPDGKPKFGLNFYAVNKRGEFGAASLYPGRYAAHVRAAPPRGSMPAHVAPPRR